ncbi:MAG TPA: tripartite tricarboxylate transporter permease, partial [Methyloceanibacter sp.]|nr:tripartite tricarboxylate transporter permease [Methyloceanibacter sp.]
AFANILGSGLCFLFSGQLAKLCTLRYTLIMPIVLSLVYIGAFEGTRQWGDLYSLLFFGILGWAMKHFKWPRPPLVLGFILGKVLERYMFISIQRYGAEWMERPIVIVFFCMAALSLLRPFIQDVRRHGGAKGMLSDFGAPKLKGRMVFPFFMLCLFAVMVIDGTHWNIEAKIIPLIVGSGAILFVSISLLNEIFARPGFAGVGEVGEKAKAMAEQQAAVAGKHDKIHMDIASTIEHLPTSVKLTRGSIFFGWLVGFLCSMAVIGLIPTVPLFVAGYMRLEGRERWTIVIPYMLCITIFIYFLFDQLLAIPWPPTYLGDFFPALKAIPSV